MKNPILPILCAITIMFVFGFALYATAGKPQLKDLGNGICQDSKTGIMWQINKSRSFKESEKAINYANTLDLGGFSDWRLPTMDELKYLKVEIYDKKKNGDCKLKRPASKYWADATNGGIKPGKLEASGECGGGYKFAEKSKGYVRAVRQPAIER